MLRPTADVLRSAWTDQRQDLLLKTQFEMLSSGSTICRRSPEESGERTGCLGLACPASPHQSRPRSCPDALGRASWPSAWASARHCISLAGAVAHTAARARLRGWAFSEERDHAKVLPLPCSSAGHRPTAGKEDPPDPTTPMAWSGGRGGEAFDGRPGPRLRHRGLRRAPGRESGRRWRISPAGHDPEKLDRIGFRLYAHCRPEVPVDLKGWGAKAPLDLKKIPSAAGSG